MIGMPDEKPPIRIAALADQCVQCGLCLPVCPTYALDRNEAESPRGRIAIAAALARGQVSTTPALREHLDHCLGCLNCEKVCPANVQYGELLIETRAMLGPSPGRPERELALIRQPARWRRLRRIAGWTGFAHWKPLLQSLLPPDSPMRAALALWPRQPLPKQSPLPLSNPTAGETVALFPGCIASVEDAEAQQAAITLLRAAGYRVTKLPAFCCGAMDLHGGDSEHAAQAARQVRAAWEKAGADHLVSVTPGCIGTLRHALPGADVIDPVTLLASRADRLSFRPLPEHVAVHLPCTQSNVTRSDTALLKLLQRVPKLDAKALSRPPHCCGAAGTHMLEYPERAARLRDETLRQAATLAPQRLLSSNIGCRLHLAAGMGAVGQSWPHQHPLVLLAQQLET
ncbi:glycolate oxidase iron-sulfur subunit [Dyella sp. OK004]|uniref:(Fe-S)-binding protein n=1 Tax=Dyella sp. OK004 TaxID=1855292 RepID=UPI0008EDD014|nr:(Fe-S)-binding protein [Dyella sp. OK004]SFR91373.1 glycolate oxidase iron-sulfur subunit [Dyella sp. OK004]